MPLHILEHQSLQPFNTFGFEASARFFVEVTTLDEAREALQFARDEGVPVLALGEGSNMVLSSDVPGLVIKVGLKGKETFQESDDAVLLRVAAGENWHNLVQWSLEQGFSGLENLSLIPGTVGAAPIQNIGAYGVELKDVFQSLEALDRENGELVELDRDACCFAYRESIFKGAAKGRYLITHVTFKLSKKVEINTGYGAVRAEMRRLNLPESPQSVSQAVCSLRRSKLPDPVELGNAGSFFKNPVIDNEQFLLLKTRFPDVVSYPDKEGFTKLAAGWLIDQCGWKGHREGRVGVHVDQALVLVNYGGGTAEELLGLAGRVQKSVSERFGIVLEMEPGIYPALE